MGISIPHSSGDRLSMDIRQDVVVQPSASDPPAGGPDASKLHPADFPQREMPPVGGPRDANYQVVYRQSVFDDIHAHGKSSLQAEVCGVLVGDIYSDRYGAWAYVEHCIRGNEAVGKQTQVTITSETWTRIHETLERNYPGKKIVGWYHTHPGFGIFLSGMDLFIQNNFFNQPWQIASVYDPHSEDEGVFVWRAGEATRENFLVENNTGAAMIAGGASNDAVEELKRRIRGLERRMDFLLTGFLLLILIGLIAPLVWMYVTPEVNLSDIRRIIHAASTQPSGASPAKMAQTVPAQAPVPPIPAPVMPAPATRPAAAKPITAGPGASNVASH